MSVSDDGRKIISLVNRFEQEIHPQKKQLLLDEIEKYNESIKEELTSTGQFYKNVMKTPSISKEPFPQKKATKKSKEKKVKHHSLLPKSKKKKLMEELNIDEEELKRLYHSKEKKSLIGEDFTVYVPSEYGKVSNKLFGDFVDEAIIKKGSLFKNLSDSVKISGMNVLSKTYVSMILFSTFLGAIAIGVLATSISILMNLGIALTIMVGLSSLILAGILIFVTMYAYPASEAARKSKAINNDLPFAIIHMSAVAGSGARPLSIFRLLLNSEEYKGLESEIKKIVNYVNLFGYDLSTALKSVSLRTPSKRLRELLNGMGATIESGGSLKSYLNSVADNTMNTYRLERKKYVESLSTYSDLYTGILIAAPLLFMVALAIINIMGGKIGGMSVSSLAWGGTFIVIPVVNVLFYLVLNITQPTE